MMFEAQTMKRVAMGAALCAFGMIGTAAAQDAAPAPPVLVLLDRTAVDYGEPPHIIPADAVNAEIANVGLRDALPYFAARIGTDVPLPANLGVNDGWFSMAAAPATWASEPGLDDGLENFVLAGAGLGSPDDDGNRTSLLGDVLGVTPLRGDGLAGLVGRTACAVIYDSDIVISDVSGAADLTGATLGATAFEILSVDGADAPTVNVKVLSVTDTCRGAIAGYAGAAPAN